MTLLPVLTLALGLIVSLEPLALLIDLEVPAVDLIIAHMVLIHEQEALRGPMAYVLVTLVSTRRVDRLLLIIIVYLLLLLLLQDV